jgi:hypothetical protein
MNFICHTQKMLTIGAFLEFFPEHNEFAVGNENPERTQFLPDMQMRAP